MIKIPIDETKTSYRERKLSPKSCDKSTYRTKKVKHGVSLVVCKTKSDVKSKGKSKAKLKVQSIVRNKTHYKKNESGKIVRRKKPLTKKPKKKTKKPKKKARKPRKKTKSRIKRR